MDDFLTQPWFIGLLGLVLAIMMLSFGAMVFVKRKHMIMKQAALKGLRGMSIGFFSEVCEIKFFFGVQALMEMVY